MKSFRNFAWLALAAGVALTGTSTLMAQERYDRRDLRNDRFDVRQDVRDVNQDYVATNRLKADISRDQVKLNCDIRDGRQFAAAADARDLARDQNSLRAYQGDIQHDRQDIARDRRDVYRDHSDNFRGR
jgi:hypothetical protein